MTNAGETLSLLTFSDANSVDQYTWDYLQPSGPKRRRSRMKGIPKLHSILADHDAERPGSDLFLWFVLQAVCCFQNPRLWSSVCAVRFFFCVCWPDSPVSEKKPKSFGQLITYVLCSAHGRQRCIRYHSVQCDGWWLRTAIRILSCSLRHSHGEPDPALCWRACSGVRCQTHVGENIRLCLEY